MEAYGFIYHIYRIYACKYISKERIMCQWRKEGLFSVFLEVKSQTSSMIIISELERNANTQALLQTH